MAFRRKFKRGASKRRPFRRYRRRTYKKKPQKIHFFKRTKVDEFMLARSGFVALQSDVADNVYNDFKLDQLPNVAEYTALYDLYKICGIKQRYVFAKNSEETSTGNTFELPQLITLNDFNDATALANEAEALQYPSYKARRLDREVKRYFKPKFGDSNQTIRAPWLATDAGGIAEHHYGIKSAVNTYSSAGGNLGIMRVYTTFYIAFKDPK